MSTEIRPAAFEEIVSIVMPAYNSSATIGAAIGFGHPSELSSLAFVCGG